MFAKGLELMVLGMSVVFLFLGVLILAIQAASYPFRRQSNIASEEGTPPHMRPGDTEDSSDDIAAIVASVADYTRERF